MTTLSSPSTQNPTDREAIAETIIDFIGSLDRNSEDLLRDSTTNDIIFDRTSFAKLGIGSGKVDKGQDTIINTILAAVGPMTTSHHVSNFRIKVMGDKASFTANALAYHHKEIEQPRESAKNLYTMGNTYEGDLVKTGGKWKLSRFKVEPVWQSGNIAVVSSH